jgi:hypothetical protein
MLSEVSQFQKDQSHTFFSYVNDPNINIYINTSKIICMYMHIYNIFAIVGLFEETSRRERKTE